MELFERTLDSVIHQSYQPIEIIIVNDHTDSIYLKVLNDIVSRKLNLYSSSIVVLTSTKVGAPAARNLGFKSSKGDFIQFLDSDDILLPDKIMEQVAILKNDSSLDLTYSKAQFVNEDLIPKSEFWGKALVGNYLDYFLFSWQTMCPLYRRSAIMKFGLWDEKLTINQDWEFSIRYIIKGAKSFFSDTVQSLFVQHSKGNIGDASMNLKKAKGKFQSTNAIYFLLKEKQLLNPQLKRLFLKRWIYVLILLSTLKEKKEFLLMIREIKSEVSPVVYFALRFLKWTWISKLILRIYEKKLNK